MSAVPLVARERLWFEAALRPHRSLGQPGFRVLMAVFAAICLACGLFFLVIGAWPVFGFFGLDVLLLWWAFRANYRAARDGEDVRLTDAALIVQRRQRGAARQWSFQPYWVRLIDEGEEREHRLLLASHGRKLAIAECLSPPERQSFGRDLAGALDAWRRGAAPELSPRH